MTLLVEVRFNTIKKGVISSHHMHSYYLYLLDELLAERGIDATDVLRNTGLNRLTKLGTQLLSAHQLDTLFGNALASTNDPYLGVALGAKINRVPPGVLGDALMTSANIGQAIDTITRFLSAVLPSLEINVQTCNGRFSVEANNRGLRTTLYHCYTEILFGAIITSGRLLIDRSNIPEAKSLSRVEFSYPRPRQADLHLRVFGEDTVFGCPRCALSMAEADLKIPLATANYLAQPLLQRECERLYSSDRQGQTISARVLEELHHTRTSFPTCATMATRLNLSESTLRRRLAKEGRPYQGLVDRARQQLAHHYLVNTKVTVSELASLLGFSDSANFRRAYKRWSGQTPSATRQRNR